MAGSATGADAVVQTLVGILTTYLQAQLTAVFTAAGLTAPTLGSVVGERTPPTAWAQSVVVMHVLESDARVQTLSYQAPRRVDGECRVLCLVGLADATESARYRRLWARAVAEVLHEYWRVYDDRASCLMALETRVEADSRLDEVRRHFRGWGEAGSASQIDPVLIRVSYSQRQSQTTRV